MVLLMPYKFKAYGLSDRGLVRTNNEDAWALLSEDQLFILADGMGGHQAGEIAAREAVDNLIRLLKKHLQPQTERSLNDVSEIIRKTFKEVNSIIYQLGNSSDEFRGMGTTLCCILLQPEGCVYAHVGDSRIYRLRRKKLLQLTQDHSLLRELIEMGQLSEDKADGFMYKNVLTRAIGTESSITPTVHTDKVQVGDIFVMCSDGLTDLLTQEEIQSILLSTKIENVPSVLIAQAKERGGFDNITVVVIKVQGKYETTDLS